jgi:hypothetical protein
MAKVRAYVYQDGLIFKVYPPVVILKEGDKFELVNTVDKDCTWTVPAGPFVGGKVSEKVAKKSTSPEKTANAGPFGTAYQVMVGVVPAIAHSDPVVIIDP